MNISHRILRWTILLTLTITLVAVVGCSSSTTPTSPASTTPVTSLAATTPPTTSTQLTTPATSPTISTPAPTGPAVTVDLTAQNISFDKSTITVPANAKVTINFNNKDSGIPHNFAVYTDSSATTTIFVGDVVTNSKTIVYQFTAPSKPGTYFFLCDIHPTIMTGSFIVQ